ncbi:MAG: response regulator transcription factor, partial [Candidatus Omnitrophica bacterium]|nr:response regulator transcription factor [Candidatus Omnitrophota bacterium]
MTDKKIARKILIVEDDRHILRIIRDALEGQGYIVLAAQDGQTGLDLAIGEEVDLVILDVMLPYLSGFEIAEKLRKKKMFLPIIILTAKDTEADKVAGLGLGVDDYLTKPFSVKELVARVQNRIRRREAQGMPKEPDDIVKIGKAAIDFAKMEVRKGAKRYVLTKRELDIIRYLIGKKGRVVSRYELLEVIWGFESAPLTRTVDVF